MFAHNFEKNKRETEQKVNVLQHQIQLRSFGNQLLENLLNADALHINNRKSFRN